MYREVPGGDGRWSTSSEPYSPTAVDPSEHWPVSRWDAESVPAIQQALQVIAGRGSTLPLRRWSAEGVPLDPGTFIERPEPADDLPLQQTLLNTLRDMCLGGVGYWRIMLRDYRGFPLAALHLDPETVGPRTHSEPGVGIVTDGYYVGGVWIPAPDMIRFRGPILGGWCTAGSRAIRSSLALERAARRYAEEPVPSVALKNESGIDLTDAQVKEVLQQWRMGRQSYATGYIGAALSAQVLGFSARELQLVEGRQQAVLELARLTGLPSGVLGAAPSGTSMTYRSLESEAHELHAAMSPYLSAIETRLSAEDITPRGQSVRFDLTAFLRPDMATVVTMVSQLLPLGVLESPEARQMLGLAAVSAGTLTRPAELPTPGNAPVA
jgi:hypothetical protein